jgi:LPXTG-motif cell wall-anchored protein
MLRRQKTNNVPWLGLALVGAGFYLARRRSRAPFSRKVIVITGGTRGLGLELARQFADEGASLALLARNCDEVCAAEAELFARGVEVLALTCDLRDPEQIKTAFEKIHRRFGRIDVLINNAGIIQVGPYENMTLHDYDDALKVHFWAPLHTMLAVIPGMRAQGGGRIVNISSIGGKIAVPHLLPYSASKFALTGLSDGMRAELAKDNIAVTTVCPGLMRTGSHVNALFKGDHKAEYAWFAISDANPLASVNSRRAARKIVEATRQRRARLVISLPAKLAILANELAPGLAAQASAMIARLLPGPVAGGTRAWTGRESRTPLTRSLLTRLADKKIEPNNEEIAVAPQH